MLGLSLDNVTNGLVIYPKGSSSIFAPRFNAPRIPKNLSLTRYAPVIRARLDSELPFIASENIIMKLVSKGASRQEAHEQVRVLSHQAGWVVKSEGKPNDLIERIRNTEYFAPIHEDLDSVLDPALYIGRSVVITERMCAEADEKLAKYREYLDKAETAQLSV